MPTGEVRSEQRSGKSSPWYTNGNWLLLILAVAVALWLAHLFFGRATSGPTAQAVSPAAQSLAATGPNLLENAGLSHGFQDWIQYHNATPMAVSPIAHGGGVEIKLSNAANSVQEVNQILKNPPPGPIIVSGTIRISGAPLPAQSSAWIIFVDSSNAPTSLFGISAVRGVGSFPFAVPFTPNGSARQLVLAVILGSATNDKTAVSFENLKVNAAAR